MRTRDRSSFSYEPSELEIQYLIRMNDQLKKIEAFLRKEAAHINREISQRHVIFRDEIGGTGNLPPHIDPDSDWLYGGLSTNRGQWR